MLSHLPKCLGGLSAFNISFEDYIALNFCLARKEIMNLCENKSLVKKYMQKSEEGRNTDLKSTKCTTNEQKLNGPQFEF